MNTKQNELVEKMARRAAAGKGYDWAATPIAETDLAEKSCPYRSRGLVADHQGNWWVRGEPGFLKKQGEGIARSVGLDLAYCGEPLSDTIAETPDGYWICRNATIGRSGFQKYKVKEIFDPENLLADYDDDEEVELWRDRSEVFSPATIASFEGKSLTLGHPPDLLNPDTDTDFAIGHVQNVREGTEPLDSGNWPLLADLVVKDRAAIDAIRSGERELSSGYTYKLAREGNRFDQRQILGNHVALVEKGRAGPEAKIETGALATSTHDDRDRRSGKQRENVWGRSR